MTHAFRLIREYGDLVNALRDQRHALGMSCIGLDARAGWDEGYANKLENWDKKYGRGVGPMSLPLWLESLGLALIVVQVGDRRQGVGKADDRQMSLDLIGGRMNSQLVRKGFKRFPAPTLVQLAA